ncbi:hypothetical protein L7F22_052868 [Adiantum nelumboides]|nr:hypothetical protein [Adiantum nelumboides]
MSFREGGSGRNLSTSRSPSPDPDLVKFLKDQNATTTSSTEEAYHRKLRIAAGGVSHAKNRVQREREEAERRKKEEEEYAAVAYREFVEDMQVDGRSRGGRRDGDTTKERSKTKERSTGFVRAGGSAYTPDSVKHKNQGRNSSSILASHSKSIERDQAFNVEEDETGLDKVQSTEKDMPPKRKGAMQNFLGELQRDQARREERLRSRISEKDSISSLLARETGRDGARETHDPNSTNVCILNLPGYVSEQTLGEYFSYFGDIASVKIMWPKMEDARMVMTSNGVSARETKHEGATGFVNFMYKSDAEHAYKQIEGSQWRGCLLRTGWGKSLSRPFEPMFFKSNRSKKDFESEQKSNEPIEHSTSTAIRFKRSRSPGSIPHRRKRPQESFSQKSRFDDDGYASFYSTDSEEESERENLQKQTEVFGEAARARFDAMLRSLTGRRERIARVMLFALEYAHCAKEITDRLIQSLLVPSTPLPRKLARLHAISDILHNCSAPASSAWRYRSLFESRMEKVFLHWGDISNAFQGRIKREACKDMLRQLLNVWETWLIFDVKQIENWRENVERGSVTSMNAATALKDDDGDDHESIEDIDGEDIDGENIDGEDIDGEDIDGEDIDGEDIDGEDIDGEDIDGEDIDGEDIDGEDM